MPLSTLRRLPPPARPRPAVPATSAGRRAAERAPVRAPSRDLTYELAGPAGAPLVVVLGGISATRHVTSTAEDPAPGWWEAAVGPGRGVDTGRYRVLGVDFLDGGRAADGRPLRAVTTADQADALARLLDALGVARAHAVVGASYGGMVALAFGARHPARAARLIVVSAAHESHPMSTALRVLQRRVVELGLETGRAADALALARGIAMTTYRTPGEFAERFGGGEAGLAEVAAYLAHCGTRYAARCAPERFLALSHSLDAHRVSPEAVRVPATLVAAEGDQLVPEAQMRELAARLGAPHTLVRLATRCGHDGFLTEPAAVGRILAAALESAPADGAPCPTPNETPA